MSLFEELIRGVGVIIDDQVFSDSSGDEIIDVRKKLEAKHIPLLCYETLPTEKIPHFGNVSFIILDWNLMASGDGTETAQVSSDPIFDFLGEVKKITDAPVFIISNQGNASIIAELKAKMLCSEDSSENWIFVKDKSALRTPEDALVRTIDGWLKKAPSLYVHKKMAKMLREATVKVFHDFTELETRWPSILLSEYSKDGVDGNEALTATMLRNIEARMPKPEYKTSICGRSPAVVGTGLSIAKVLAAERFVPVSELQDSQFCTGDLYFKEDLYFLNIRAQCDLLRGDTDSLQLYCITGKLAEFGSPDVSYSAVMGQFVDKVHFATLAGALVQKVLQFDFRTLSLHSAESLRTYKIGRLLPPFITQIQQRFAFYFHRQGVPRTPECLIPTPVINELIHPVEESVALEGPRVIVNFSTN